MTDPALQPPLAERLAELPSFDPPAGIWSRIEARAATPRRRPVRYAAFAAIAASLLVAIVFLPRVRVATPPTAAVPVAQAELGPTVDTALDQRSAELEGLLAALPQEHTARASTGLAATMLEDRIALVDERLSGTSAEPLSASITSDLKRQRFVLLDSLVNVRYASAVAVSL